MSKCRPCGDDHEGISCVHFESTARLGLGLFGDRGELVTRFGKKIRARCARDSELLSGKFTIHPEI